MRVRGYAGRKFVGRRVLDNSTPGMPKKHALWAGLHIDTTRVFVRDGSLHPLAETLAVAPRMPKAKRP